MILSLSMHVCDAQGLANMYTGGAPSVIGMYGAVHALERALRRNLKSDISFGRFAMAVDRETYLFEESHPRFTPYHKRFGVTVASTVDTRRLAFSLVLLLDIAQGEDVLAGALQTNGFQQAVESIRILGGMTMELSCTVETMDIALLTVPKTYSFIADATDAVRALLSEADGTGMIPKHSDPLEAILFLTEWMNPADRRAAFAEHDSKVPPRDYIGLAVGYIGLEGEPRTRTGLDAHLFVEPMVGLGEFVWAEQAKTLESPDKLFWHYHAQTISCEQTSLPLFICTANKETLKNG